MKISFNNDYSTSAHPIVLQAISALNQDNFIGYGVDNITLKAAKTIKELVGNPNSSVHFLVGGTQTNLTFIASVLRPIDAVIAVDSSHIYVHETGAVEANGNKILITPGRDGKIVIEEIAKILKTHSDEHMVNPKLVFISNATELGTTYNREDLIKLSSFCKKHNLYLFVDGARLANALAATNLTLSDLGKYCDAFYLGGTKNGLLFGEALVINNPMLAKDFRFNIKQKGGLLAKGFLLGAQYNAIMKDQLYLKLADHANAMGQLIKKALIKNKYFLFSASNTNQIFVKLSNSLIKKLEKDFIFSIWSSVDAKYSIVRFVTSYATTKEEVAALIKALK
jgi:threonine aldolase